MARMRVLVLAGVLGLPRRTQTEDLGVTLGYDTEQFVAQAQVARDMAAVLSNLGAEVTPQTLKDMLEHNMLMHPEIYGTCIAFEPDSFPWNAALDAASVTMPGLDEGVPSAAGTDTWADLTTPWTLKKAEIWPGKEAIIYAPYGYRGKDWAPGKIQQTFPVPSEFFTMDLADGYNYWDLTTEWYHGPRTEFMAGKLNFTDGYWTQPYFDEGAGNIEMVTFSVPFWRKTPIPSMPHPDAGDADAAPYGAPLQRAFTDHNGVTRYFAGIATIDLVLEALSFDCPEEEHVFDVATKQCRFCVPGTMRVEGPPPTCEVCNPGFYAAGGAGDTCAQCVHGSFSGRGAAACTLCDEVGTNGFTTLTTGATSRAACTCGVGTFWNARDDKCVACRAEAYCPGGLHLPVVYEGKYALYLGSVDNHADAQASKHADTWSSSSDRAGAFYELEVYNCGSSTHCPGASLSFGFAEYGLAATTQAGVRAAGCPDLRLGLACAACEDDYYGVEDCVACSGASSVLNAVLLIMLPFVMMCLYRATTSGGTNRIQSAFVLVSTCGMAAFFMQTIAVLDNMSVAWPEQISWLFNISRVFMFDLGGLSLSCLHGNGFAAKYWASILIPIVILVMTGVGFVISQAPAIPESWQMMPNHTLSMIGMFMSALYITLVKVVLTYFECPENPAAPATLAKYKDIVCDSDDHAAAMIPMALGLVLYVLGFYLAFCWAAWVAPARWTDLAFRERWKFMLTRWRPDVYYWGTVVMTRNLLVAIAGIISSETRVQLCYVCLVVTVVFAVTAVYQPWRATPLNHYDVLSSIILCFIGILGLIFVSLQEEVTIYERLEMFHVAEAKTDLRDSFATATTAMVGVFMALFVFLIGWTLMLLMPAHAEKQAQEHAKACSELFQQFKSIAEMPGFSMQAERCVLESTSYDRTGLKNFLSKMVADEMTIQGGATDTYSINKAKEMEVSNSSKCSPDLKNSEPRAVVSASPCGAVVSA